MYRARSFLFLGAILLVGWLGLPDSSQAAATLCRFRCLWVQEATPACTEATATTWRDDRSRVRLFVFGQTQGSSYATPIQCSTQCVNECDRVCPGGPISDASGAMRLTPGTRYCIHGQPPDSLGPFAVSACQSGTPVWRYPTCEEPPAGTPTVGGSCQFTCVRGTARTPYSGEPIRCANTSDCESRCEGACRDSGGTCLRAGATPAPTPSELPRCDLPQAGGDAAAHATGSPTTLTNPLNTTDIGELIARFIRAITGIAGSMALLMLVVGGVMWMTAEGSDRVGTAQTIIKNACLGLLLIFFAYSLVSLFLLVLGL